MDISFLKRRKGSLLLIFLFTVGLLGVMVTGIYWLVINQGVQGSLLDAEAEREMADSIVESLVVPAVAHQGELILLDRSDEGWSFSASAYASELKSLLVQALSPDPDSSSEQTVWDDLSVSVSDFPDEDDLGDKSSTPSVDDDNLENPYCRFAAVDREMTVTISGTLARTGRPYSWSKQVVLFREVPSCEIPYVLYSDATGQNDMTFSASLVAWGGTPTAVGTLTKAWDYNGSAYTGVDANKLCKAVDSPEGVLAQQAYAADPDVIVVEFSSGGLSVESPSGVSLPSAFSTVTFDGQTRCVINLASLPSTGDYIDKKWFIDCVSDSDKIAGVVIKETTSLTSVTNSIMTNGHLYLWMLGSSTAHTPELFGTNYGAIAVASADYDGSSARVSSSDTIDLEGFLSLADAPQSLSGHFYQFLDEFTGSGSLSGRDPADESDCTSPDGDSWTVHSGSSLTTADGSSGTGVLTISGSDADFSIPMVSSLSSYGAQRTEVGLDTFPIGSSITIIFSTSVPYDDQNYLSVALTRTGTATYSYELNSVVEGTTEDSATGSCSYSTGTSAKVFYLDYMPATKAIAAHLTDDFSTSTLLFTRKLEGAIDGSPAYVETQVGLNSSTDSVGLEYFSLGAARGTMIVSPHTGNLDVEMTGGIATSTGLDYAGSGSLTLSIETEKSVRKSIRNYCERIFTTYPYSH